MLSQRNLISNNISLFCTQLFFSKLFFKIYFGTDCIFSILYKIFYPNFSKFQTSFLVIPVFPNVRIIVKCRVEAFGWIINVQILVTKVWLKSCIQSFIKIFLNLFLANLKDYNKIILAIIE